jgi:hypothetical protein
MLAIVVVVPGRHNRHANPALLILGEAESLLNCTRLQALAVPSWKNSSKHTPSGGVIWFSKAIPPQCRPSWPRPTKDQCRFSLARSGKKLSTKRSTLPQLGPCGRKSPFCESPPGDKQLPAINHVSPKTHWLFACTVGLFLMAASVSTLLVAAGPVFAAQPTNNFQASIKALQWRNIGPFNGGRGT